MTYSIAAVERSSGLVGVAAQSHHLAVGSQLAFADPTVGAVAVQSYADRAYGPAILEALRAGQRAQESLNALTASDRRASRAQLAVVTTSGETAVHTGSRCVPAAGSASAAGVSVQANMVASQDVWTAALQAFSSVEGHLATRLLAALDAAEAAGGDLRGRESAVLLVVGPTGARVDLRVDDHPEPLAELHRLTALQFATDQMSAAFAAARDGRIDEATETLAAVQETFGNENLEPTVWAAVLLARHRDLAGAAQLMRRARRRPGEWSEFIRGLARVDLAPDDRDAIAVLTEPPG